MHPSRWVFARTRFLTEKLYRVLSSIQDNQLLMAEVCHFTKRQHYPIFVGLIAHLTCAHAPLLVRSLASLQPFFESFNLTTFLKNVGGGDSGIDSRVRGAPANRRLVQQTSRIPNSASGTWRSRHLIRANASCCRDLIRLHLFVSIAGNHHEFCTPVQRARMSVVPGADQH